MASSFTDEQAIERVAQIERSALEAAHAAMQVYDAALAKILEDSPSLTKMPGSAALRTVNEQRGNLSYRLTTELPSLLGLNNVAGQPPMVPQP